MAAVIVLQTSMRAVRFGCECACCPLFGFGEKVGALGIQQTHIFGPEVEILGIGLNLALLGYLWCKYLIH